ncbi:MAG: hypothetical protein QOD53_2055, partial [Thermoleophilaceae bacterium]|nr:hypothetical protein [Thermoleophilaceae bacterium]
MLRVLRHTTILCVLLAAATLGMAGQARASATQESIFQEDRLLLSGDDALRQKTLDEVKALGANTVRVLVAWSHFAPDPGSTTRPGFDATDPGAYPAGAFNDLDALVREAGARGLGVLMNPSSPIPHWASGCSKKNKRLYTCRPNPGEFGAFVTALGKRYSGSYGGLPRVARWTVWNEADLGSWLTPQFTGSKKHPVPASPVMYRNLFYAASDALTATGHGNDQLLAGETGPIGQTSGSLVTRSMAPLAFYRTLFCLGRSGKPLKGSVAKRAHCTGSFRQFDVNGISNHPYTRAAISGPTAKGAGDDLTLAQTRNLENLLHVAGSRGRIPSGTPVFFTEYGVQTDPPDSIGVSPRTQAAWINQAEWLAYLDPHVKSVAQFELTDPKDPSTFNTGLRFFSGKAKPSLTAYRVPIWVIRAGKGVQVFGGVRPAMGMSTQIDIQRRTSTKKPYKTVK